MPSSCADWGKRTAYTSTTGDAIRYDNGAAIINGKAFSVKDCLALRGDGTWTRRGTAA